MPVVTPLERNEDIKNPAYVEQRAGTRLASRHFRNHVWRMSQEGSWTEFKTFCAEWLTEISLLDVQFTATANRLAVFYQEAGSRVPKELAWAGDGVQIWVQLLWHIYRTQGAKTIVLDEPEVYLHPDLQRRLVRLLESTGAQIILASHSADVVAESPQEGLLWVDRRAGGARRLRTRQAISSLGVSLGSSYNLILARSMRARLVLGSDCEDLRVLRDLAKLIGAQHIANESDVSVVSVKRDTVLSAASAYVTSLREALPPNIPAGTLLAGALISPDVREAHIKASSQAGIKTVFHSRAAIENYLLVPEILARASGAGLDSMRERLNVACASLEDETRSAVIASWLGSRLVETKQQFAAAESAFSDAWNQRALRPNIVSANRVIDMLNESLEAEGYRTVTPRLLVRAAKPQELATDLFTCVFALDGQVH